MIDRGLPQVKGSRVFNKHFGDFDGDMLDDCAEAGLAVGAAVRAAADARKFTTNMERVCWRWSPTGRSNR